MKKKGFTLIELLAVIVILAIIALIVTPKISSIIESTKKEAFKQSVVGIIQSGEYYIAKHVLETNGQEITFPITFTCNGTNCSNNDKTLEFKGKVPVSGTITVESKKEVIAELITDGKYCASGTKTNIQISKNCSDIDTTKPSIQASLSNAILELTMEDLGSGLDSYCVTTSDSSNGCTWVANEAATVSYELTEAGTYYAYAKDKKGNISIPASVVATEDDICPISIGDEFTLDPEGPQTGIIEFIIPWDGTYRLEVWGAQGGSANGCAGAYGGYAKGEKYFTKGTVLYIVVGGMGISGGYYLDGGHHTATSHSINPGYNGTVSGWFNAIESGQDTGSGSGGGATNIGTVNSTLSGTTGQYVIGYGGNGGRASGGWNDQGNVKGPYCSAGTVGSAWTGN